MGNQSGIYKIGSSNENDIVIDHFTVSLFHAEIFKDPENNVFYSDMQSKYGSFVNGKRILEPILLQVGDELTIGENQIVDWEYLILGKAAIRKLPIETKNNKNLIKDNLDIVLIYGLILLMLFFLSFLLG